MAGSLVVAASMRTVLVGGLVAGMAVAWAPASWAAAPPTAPPPPPRVTENVDQTLCPFPLDIIVTSARTQQRVPGGGIRLTGKVDVSLRNVVSNRKATLSASGPLTFYPATGSVTFEGHQLWTSQQTLAPYLATDGNGSLLAPNYFLSPSNLASKVIDPCALVADAPPSVQPVTTPAPWGLPAFALSQINFAHLIPLIGNLVRHNHDHLDVIINGHAVTVPAGVGQAEPQDLGPCPSGSAPSGDCATGHFFEAATAIAPLHTHSTSGIIHVEADRDVTSTLGQFFDEWGVSFNQTCVGAYCTGNSDFNQSCNCMSADRELRVYVDGNRVTTDPRAIVLTDRHEIAVVYGGPGDFGSVPSTYTAWP